LGKQKRQDPTLPTYKVRQAACGFYPHIPITNKSGLLKGHKVPQNPHGSTVLRHPSLQPAVWNVILAIIGEILSLKHIEDPGFWERLLQKPDK